MKIREQVEQWRRQLHQSGVNMYNKCGTQFEFRYIRGRRRRPNAFLICGSATDKAVNFDLDNKIVTGGLAKEDEITDLARDYVNNYERKDEIQLDPDEVGKGVDQVLGETKDKAVRLVKLHHAAVAPDMRPFRTARRFTVNLDKFLKARAKLLKQEADGPDLSAWRRRVMKAQSRALNAAAKIGLDFVGEQDIVEKYHRDVLDETYGVETLNIRDTKTSRASKNQRHVDTADQLTAYALASSVVDGRLPDKVGLDVLVDLKKEPKAQKLESVRTALDVDIYLNRIANAVAGIQMGNFPPTEQSNWWCSEKYCAYHELCPYFRSVRRPQAEVLVQLDSGCATDVLPTLTKTSALAKGESDEDADA